MEASHLNSSKLHLPNILSSNFHNISRRFSIDNYQVTFHVVIFPVSDFKENESSNLKQTQDNCRSVLNSLRKGNLGKLIFALLNNNSTRNKFDYLS